MSENLQGFFYVEGLTGKRRVVRAAEYRKHQGVHGVILTHPGAGVSRITVYPNDRHIEGEMLFNDPQHHTTLSTAAARRALTAFEEQGETEEQEHPHTALSQGSDVKGRTQTFASPTPLRRAPYHAIEAAGQIQKIPLEEAHRSHPSAEQVREGKRFLVNTNGTPLNYCTRAALRPKRMRDALFLGANSAALSASAFVTYTHGAAPEHSTATLGFAAAAAITSVLAGFKAGSNRREPKFQRPQRRR